ncbi:helix-turn-helix transcriptional regulator [Amycolatopsis minnesotensis]|uniref:HTH cro/C1-type domain-containing protein n=1 Tax=Amycolatopsis minnesotensis TaxID=337894 RepID=A0ABN2SER1_9PSEU
MPDQPLSFAAYLTRVRIERGYSIRQLAARADLSPSTVKRIEDGYFRLPTPDGLLALVDALDLDIVTAIGLLDPYQRLCDRFTDAQHQPTNPTPKEE